MIPFGSVTKLTTTQIDAVLTLYRQVPFLSSGSSKIAADGEPNTLSASILFNVLKYDKNPELETISYFIKPKKDVHLSSHSMHQAEPRPPRPKQ